MAETRGRRPSWNNYKDFNRAVDAYFDACAEADIFPDYAGMLLALKISKADAKAMIDKGAPDAEEFQRIFENAALRRESWLARHMVADNKKANGCMNALKQVENGGYQDKYVDKGAKELEVKVVGLEGGMRSFK